MKIRQTPEVHIEGYKEMSINGKTLEYLNPKSIFLPTNFPSELNVLVKAGDHVKIGDVLMTQEGRFGHPFLSPIAGTVKGTVRKWYPTNRMLPMLEIENDFSEEVVDTFFFAIGEYAPEILFRIEEPVHRPDKDENRDAHNGNIQDDKPNHVRYRTSLLL